MSSNRDAPMKERAIAQTLAALRFRIRLWLLVDRASALVGTILAICLALGIIDYFIRMPRPMRLALWLIGIVAIVLAFRKFILPAFRFRPSLTDLALRIEQSPAGQESGLHDVLAAGLEFNQHSAPRSESQSATQPQDPRLERQVAAMASGLFSDFSLRQIIRPAGGARKGVSTLLFSVIPLAIVVSLAPLLTLIGVQRVFTPWANVQWPSRTALLDATLAKAHPLGTALPLRALLTRTNKAVGDTRIQLRYRVVAGDRVGDISSALMTPQGVRHDSEPAGEIYERLLDPRSLVDSISSSQASSNENRRLEYWFETADARTDGNTIELVEPPIITNAKIAIKPPGYASTDANADVVANPKAGSAGEFVSGSRDLGPGKPDTPSIAPVLAGSRVELTFALNKSIPVPRETSGPAAAKFATSLMQGATPPPDLAIAHTEKQVTLSWTANDTIRFGAILEDSFGIKSPDPTSISLIVVPDRSPTVSVIDPPQDETVLPSAIIDATGEARDDLALASLTLEARVLASKPDSPGAPPEPRGQPLSIATWNRDEVPLRKEATATTTLELSTLEVKAGDEVHLVAIAQDTFSLEGQTHPPVLSAPRKLRIIGEGQFVEQLLAELGALRAAAIRLDQDQQKLQRAAQELDKPGGADRATRLKKEQDALTERLTPPASLVKRLADRVDRNALPDRTVRQMLDDARQLLDKAANSSRDASRSLQESASANPDDAAKPEQADAARQSQAEVRDSISKLASILDQGKDGWATRREIEKLLEDQKRISDQTRDLAKQTGGKRVSDLTPSEKQDLEQVAKAQQDLAKRARAATDALQDRASKMRPDDPAQAEAMQKAAEQSSREELESTMQQASKNAGENQTASANDFQKKAEETLKQMMEELDKGAQRKDESLRRMLADLVQQLEDLMLRQNDELAKLADPAKVPANESLDGSQIRLNQDTLAVSDSVRKGPPETIPVADAVDAGATDQGSAVKSLRLAPIDSPGADRWQRSALAHLTTARDIAKKLGDESSKREEDRQREELKKAYENSLQQQIGLRADTSGFIGKELTRRDRAAVRSIGEKQEELRTKLAELQTKTKELSDAGIFNFSHKRLDTLMNQAVASLKDGAANKAVDSNQASSATVLRSLVDALSKDKNEEDFRNSDGGGGGGGGQQGGKQPIIPPIAELKLLRALQQDAASRTRSLSDSGLADETALADIGQVQRELARQGQELIKKLEKEKQESSPNVKVPNEKPPAPDHAPEPPANKPDQPKEPS